MNKVETTIKINKMIKHLKDMNALKVAINTPPNALNLPPTNNERARPSGR